MPTISDLLTDALIELRVARAGDVISPDDADVALRGLNRLLDLWNADDRAVYNDVFSDYTLTPSLNPHTMGPAGTFNVTVRPNSLEAAALNLGGSPAVFTPITVRDRQWYQTRSVPSLPMSVVTDVYYAPDWPLGKLYFFGVPTTAYGVRLWTRGLLANVTDPATAFSLPPGYQDALTLTLAERLANAFGQTVSAQLAATASASRASVFSENDETPRIATADAGVPCEGSTAGSGFNWKNRSTA